MNPSLDPDILRPGPLEPESRFTPATKLCPHPEWWHSTDADSTELEVSGLIGSLVRALQPQLVVETGAAWGQTAELIGQALQRNGHGELYTVEPDPDRADATRVRCAGLPVTVEEKESLTFHVRDHLGPIGFAFFDSLISLRVDEFIHFGTHPGYTPGAIVAFHDTADHQGLWPAIAEMEEQGMLLPIRLPTPRGLVIAEVI